MTEKEKKKWTQYTTDKIKTLNFVVDRWKERGLNGIHLGVWTVLFRNERNSLTSVTQNEIAQTLGIHTDTVRKAIRQLIKRRVISVHIKGRPGKATIYHMGVVPRERDSKTKK